MKQLKRKILIFLPEFPVLTETFIEREISELINRDNLDITILSLKAGPGSTSEQVRKKVHYIKLTPTSIIIGFACYGILRPFNFMSILSLMLKKDRVPFLFPGFTPVIENQTTFFSKLMLTRAVLIIKAFGYAHIFEKYKPDHIWVHFGSSPSSLVMCISRLLNKPYSISLHAIDVVVNGSLLTSKLETAKHVFICNKYVYDFLEKRYPLFSNKLFLQYHGVEFVAFDNYVPKTVKPLKPVIVNISRLVEKKGQKYLIEAASILNKKGLDFIIYIIGPGPLYSILVNLISKHNLNDKVQILGEGRGLPFDQTKDILSICDIFVFPAIKAENADIDGVPNGVIEAAAFRKASIVTDAGSITDLIKPNKTGIIVPQKDSVLLAESMETLIKDQQLRTRLGQNAYTLARALFNLSDNVKFYEEKLI